MRSSRDSMEIIRLALGTLDLPPGRPVPALSWTGGSDVQKSAAILSFILEVSNDYEAQKPQEVIAARRPEASDRMAGWSDGPC